MEDDPKALYPALAGLDTAIEAFWGQGNPGLLELWLAGELDDDGAPTRLPLADWPAAVDRLARARLRAGGPSAGVDERATDLVRMLLRFSRPGGRTAIDDAIPSPRAFWGRVSAAFPAVDVTRVLGWWFPRFDAEAVPPPLPAWSSAERVQGVLRADWTSRGDFLVFDQREAGPTTRFELYGKGVPWLGPAWSLDLPGSDASAAKPTAWVTNSSADLAEWSFHVGGITVTRLALMLRGRRIAILADQLDGVRPSDAPESRLDAPAGLDFTALATPGAYRATPAAAGKSAQLAMIAPGTLSFDPKTRRLAMRQGPPAGPAWLPMLVSWDHARHRKPLEWSRLTVAEQGKICPPELAWAARVSWGRSETFVVYRSFGPAGRRSFLGYSTTARFLIGRFTPEGDVEPIATLA